VRYFFLIFGLLFFKNLKAQNDSLKDSLRLVLPIGHGSQINGIECTVDNKYLFTISDDNTAKMWDIASGKLIRNFEAHQKRINGIIIDTINNHFLTYSDDNNICIWSFYKSLPLRILKGHSGSVNKAIFSTSTNEIISISDDKNLIIWDIVSGNIKKKIRIHNAEVIDLVLSKNKKRSVTFSRDGIFKVWDIDNWKCIYTGNHSNYLSRSVKQTDEMNNIYFTQNDSCIIELNIDTEIRTSKRCISNSFGIMSYAISRSGKLLVTATADKYLRIYSNSSIQNQIYELKLPGWGLDIAIDNNENKCGVAIEGGSVIEIDIIQRKINFLNKISNYNIERVLYIPKRMYLSAGDKFGSSWLIESNSGKIIKSLSSDAKAIKSLIDFDNKSNLSIGIALNNIRLFDYKNIKIEILDSAIFSKDLFNSEISLTKKQYILYGHSKVISYDYSNKNRLYEIIYSKSSIYKAGYNQSGSLIYAISNDKKIRLYNSDNGKLLDSFFIDLGYDQISCATFSKNDNILFLGSSEGSVYIYDLASHKQIYYHQLTDDFINNIYVNQTQNQIFAVGDLEIFQIDYLSGTITSKAFDSYIMSSNFDEAENKIFLASITGAVYELSNINHPPKKLFTTEYPITSLSSRLNNHILSIGHINGAIYFYDIYTQTPLFFLYNFKETDYIIKLPNSPYYMCSKEASKMLHYVTPDLKVIGFDQLDPIYNRPDIVLDSIGKYFAGGPDLELIKQYKDAWVKRMNRLGIDTSASNNKIEVPEAEIVNAENIDFNNSSGKLNFRLKASDSKHTLRRYNVFVNEVPVYGSGGIPISGNIKQFEKDIEIQLSERNNKIQVSVMNDLGLESFKYPLYVQYQPVKPVVSNTYYIGIGVDSFTTSNFNLQYCVKDVNDLGSLLAKSSNTKTTILKNKDVTKENVLKLKELLKQTTEQDKVIISCSSHGLLDNNNNFYLAMHNVDFDSPEIKGLAYEDLLGLLDSIPARKKLLLLDACNSGENETAVNKKLSNQNNVASNTGTKGIKIDSDSSGVEKSSFESMLELFVNVNNQTGTTVISAAGGKQSAFEGDRVLVKGQPIKNGAFTYSIIEYLTQNAKDKNKLTVNQLKQYAEQRVSEITNGNQKPTSRQETMEVDWGF